jgi:hypothetical protein
MNKINEMLQLDTIQNNLERIKLDLGDETPNIEILKVLGKCKKLATIEYSACEDKDALKAAIKESYTSMLEMLDTTGVIKSNELTNIFD